MLRVENLTAAYGESPVLWGIHLEVGPGEAVALLGRNGVGKTTFLRTVVGLHPVREGRLLFEDWEVTRLPAYQRARLGIAYVPQGRGILPHLTVEENLKVALAALAGRVHVLAQEIPGYIYELFPALYPLRGRKGGNLSGGQQQQLAIARALVTRPRLLLLDEPTEGLQPSVVEEIREALARIRQELRIGVLLVEQYLDFAWAFAERYYVMQKGRIVAQGRTQEHDPAIVERMLGV